MNKDGKQLRLGYTTGSCAAAASKAAAYMLLSGKKKEKIQIDTPKGILLDLDIREIRMEGSCVSCAVEKDPGDDPDITKGALIFSTVSLTDEPGVDIDGGFGVGRVTKPGLDQPVGNAAINSVPRKMIRENVEEVMKLFDYEGGMKVVISVPEGEKLAEKTFNPRLGILGGISILGTTGIVEPMSEEALVETIRTELKQRRAEGQDYVLLTPGNYGYDHIRDHMGLDPENAVMTSNFIGDALLIARDLGFTGALIIGHIGKLVKIAGGLLNTHSKWGDCRMEILASYAGAEGLKQEKIAEVLDCVSCDEGVRILKEEGVFEAAMKRLSDRVGFIMDRKVLGEMKTGAILFSKEYGNLAETKDAKDLLSLIREQQASEQI